MASQGPFRLRCVVNGGVQGFLSLLLGIWDMVEIDHCWEQTTDSKDDGLRIFLYFGIGLICPLYLVVCNKIMLIVWIQSWASKRDIFSFPN